MSGLERASAEDAARQMIARRSAQIVLIQDSKGLGTGLLVGSDGWILTNKHVAPSVGPYRVILADGRDVHGLGVHQSTHHDLAIVKVAGRFDSFLDLASEVAEDFHVGEEVYALGHPRGCRFSVSRGIISNPHREFDKEDFIQSDININPGNSGGPLVDRAGRLVGIVTMTLSYSQGMGFAVPGYVAADYARHVRRLVRHGVVKVPDALLAQIEAQRPPAEEAVLRAVSVLVESGKAAIEEEKPEEGHVLLKHRTAVVDVRFKDGLFVVTGQAAALGPSERGDARFLARVLELSGTREVGGASFSLKGDALHFGILRPTDGLDTVEALWAIDLVLHLVEEWPTKLMKLVLEGRNAAAAIAPPAAVPAAPPPGAPAQDPGYPILTLPTTDLYRPQ